MANAGRLRRRFPRTLSHADDEQYHQRASGRPSLPDDQRKAIAPDPGDVSPVGGEMNRWAPAARQTSREHNSAGPDRARRR